MKKILILVLIGSVSLFIAACNPPQPTGAYVVEEGWLGVHVLATDAAGVISGTMTYEFLPPFWPADEAACLGAEYTIEGAKGSDPEFYEEEIAYYATPSVIPDGCTILSDRLCIFVDDSSAGGDWSSMDGRWCLCNGWEPTDCEDMIAGMTLIVPGS